MDILPLGVICFAISVVSWWLSYKNVFDRPQECVQDEGDTIRLRCSPYERYWKRGGKIFPKSSIAKIQKAGSLTVFNHSDNATDIWLHDRDVDAVFEQLCSLLPDADVVEIQV